MFPCYITTGSTCHEWNTKLCDKYRTENEGQTQIGGWICLFNEMKIEIRTPTCDSSVN